MAAALFCAGAAGAAVPDLSANVAVVSNYRFRGLSLSNRKPALQGGLDLALPDGWYVGTWGSTIARYGGAHAELDIFVGKTGSVAGFDYSVTAAAYLYPHGTRVDYGELQAQLSRAIGTATLAIEVDYVPRQHNAATDNIYVGAGAEIPLPRTPLTLKLRGGYEDGFYPRKLDWEAGLSLGGEHLSAAVSLIGSDYGTAREAGRLGRTGVQISVYRHF